MNETAPNDTEIPLRGAPTEGWRWQDHELSVVFEPIIGQAASAVYCHLTGKAFGNKVTYTLRGLAAEMKRSRTTIWRAMAVLEHIGMVRIRAGGGNQESECSLVDLKKLSVSLGASHDRRRASYVLPSKRAEELSGKVAALLTTMQKKPKPRQKLHTSDSVDSNRPVANLFLLDSKRDAGDSPEKRQRSARETQMGFHLIRQKTIPQKISTPTPTPNDDSNARNDKDSADEDDPDGLLKLARANFTGVMNDLGDHLFDSSRPPAPHLANGADDWEEFGFDSLAVEAAEWRGTVLVLMLSAHDPAAARRGLEKYHRAWNASLRRWYGCEVQLELRQAQRKR